MMALNQNNIGTEWFDSRNANDLSLDDSFLTLQFVGFIVMIEKAQRRAIDKVETHWIAIKRVDGVWYNFDSHQEQPQIFEEHQLIAWLLKACIRGAHVIVCRMRPPEGL